MDYWQVEITESDIALTASAISPGLLKFKTMPLGLSDAPATFQRMLTKVLTGLTPHLWLVYLDELIIYGRDLATHLSNLETVFQCVYDAV